MNKIIKAAIFVMAMMMSATFAFGQGTTSNNNASQGPVYDEVNLELINLGVVGHTCDCNNDGWEDGWVHVTFKRFTGDYTMSYSIGYADHIGPVTIQGYQRQSSYQVKVVVDLHYDGFPSSKQYSYTSPLYQEGVPVVINGNNFSTPHCCWGHYDTNQQEEDGQAGVY